MGFRIQKSKENIINRFFQFYSAYIFIFILFCLTFISVLLYEVYELKRDFLSNGEFIVLKEDEFVRESVRRLAGRCTFYSCFDVYRCEQSDNDLIKVYVYPEYKYMDTNGDEIILPYSKEFRLIIDSIINSNFYTDDPRMACLLVPNVDTLNLEKINAKLLSRIFTSHPGWNHGRNHLLFTMINNNNNHHNSSLALIAGAGFSTWSYRYTHDISIPFFSPFTRPSLHPTRSQRNNRKWLLISSQPPPPNHHTTLHTLNNNNITHFLLLNHCKHRDFRHRCDHQDNVYKHPQILQQGTFCLIMGSRGVLDRGLLLECMGSGSIPVVLNDPLILPFHHLIDWPRASIVMHEEELPSLIQQLSSISRDRVKLMRKQVLFLYHKYFSSLEAITQTTLRTINQRVFPYAAATYEENNDKRTKAPPPIFLPITMPKSQGFTAVILTYNRLDSLYKLIQQLSPIPSLSKILIVWNNQATPPPTGELWPTISKPLKVIQTSANKLSNRFYPYKDIETEAVFSLDDDILTLTTQEIQFAFEVWCDFPDRIVGFPSRLHVYDRQSKWWRYESEWVSSVSMVLTAAAFYHKHYNYLYTTSLPSSLLEWVDGRMNCEDILFNFMVTHLSHKPPIKVTPRQRFKCSNCSEIPVSSDMGEYMIERSACINYFVKAFNLTKPALIPVEFRADPLLYKEPFPPPEFRRFNDVGSL